MNIGKAGNPVISAKLHGYGSGAILMYDTTRRESFVKCPGWIDAFKNHASKEAVLLLLADRRSRNNYELFAFPHLLCSHESSK
ncbi:hypothetical protein GBAR_LOCUS12963 [Geodia barretti]|uniref:Uncharacterized protein n=1 Tax=Geodia barretti TaxID=519541 RepID=A0AA35S2F1_GEOBA|nr:hypothetical protein GBAR_LOCUS12963 [Geodia barretti]